MLAGDPLARVELPTGIQVSIRARHCWRAIPVLLFLYALKDWFQSAPAIAGGRSQSAGACQPPRSRFNPRPPLLAGDPDVDLDVHEVVAVSIRARHCWRAIHRPRRRRSGSNRFQSAPAIAGGRSQTSHVADPSLLVSIRARHCWRAIQAADGEPRRPCGVSIRARHCWRAILRASVVLTK